MPIAFIYDVRLQRTIKNEIQFKGVGLHTGVNSEMCLKPAPRDSGIVFYRSDKDSYINANVKSVTDTSYATTLSNGTASVKTVEHILAAAAGLGIDNMVIEINGPEVPAMDGSSIAFVERIINSGVARQASNRPYLKVTKPIVFQEGRAEIALLPYDGMMISYQIDFNHRILGHQKMEMEFTADSFRQSIAPARTFGFFKDVETLKSMGLALGGSLDNAIVIDDSGVMNPSGLRFPDEFIRHKVLDFIGDISLSGFPILGHFAINRSGHTANAKFLRHFLQNTDCWEMITDVEHSLKASA